MKSSRLYLTLTLLSGCLLCVFGIPVDNGVEGNPVIECGTKSLSVTFNVRNAFEGHVFVKGLFNRDECRMSTSRTLVASLTIPYDSPCNMRRKRAIDPRGIALSANVIISFHPYFITKVDRAYSISCFFMEGDKSVTQELEVSMLTTVYRTQILPMPKCKYQILDGGPEGTPLQYSLVGYPVYHKWTCDAVSDEMFCMRIHTCYVDDGQGDKVFLLDENGCALDRYLLGNLEYLADMEAGQEAHVFKYADRPQVFFQCQITITVKEEDGFCEVPSCSTPIRGRRSNAGAAVTSEDFGTFDLTSDLSVLDQTVDEYSEAQDALITATKQTTCFLQIQPIAVILLCSGIVMLFLVSCAYACSRGGMYKRKY